MTTSINGNTFDMTRGVYRRIYAGFLRGKRINLVSLEAEATFWRLNAVADGLGNLRADCKNDVFPRREITLDQFTAWLNELVDLKDPKTGEPIPLVERYNAADGEEYLHIIGFTSLQPAGRNGRRVQFHPALPHHAPAADPTATASRNRAGDDQRPVAKKAPRKKKEPAVATPPSAPPPEVGPKDNLEASDPIEARKQCRLRYLSAVMPLLGRTDSGRHVAGSAQYEADQTCMYQWWDEIVWPEGTSEQVGRDRMAKALSLIKQANRPGKAKPMAWLNEAMKSMANESASV